MTAPYTHDELESMLADRIEITSPGGPYGALTVDNFGQPGLVDYRNPILAEAMRVVGLLTAMARAFRPRDARCATTIKGNLNSASSRTGFTAQ